MKNQKLSSIPGAITLCRWQSGKLGLDWDMCAVVKENAGVRCFGGKFGRGDTVGGNLRKPVLIRVQVFRGRRCPNDRSICGVTTVEGFLILKAS